MSLQASLASVPPQSHSHKSFFSMKLVLIFTMLLSAVLLHPDQGDAEVSLSSENLIGVVNQDRTRYGLSPLAPNEKLNKAAKAKADDILKNGYFSHYSPQGTAPWDFIRGQGFIYSFAGENLAINYTNSYELQKDFLASPSHRDNLLSPDFSDIGIAVVPGIYNGQKAVITVQMFASPARTAKAY